MAKKQLVERENYTSLPSFYYRAEKVEVSACVVHLGVMPDPRVYETLWSREEREHLDKNYNVSSALLAGWEVQLAHFVHKNKPVTILAIGCKQYATRNEALAHVDRNNISKTSGKRRPLRRVFVDAASAVAKINGWKF